MKKGKIILLLFLLGLIYFVYSQLFKQPTLFEGNFIELKQTFTHHTNDIWEVKFGPNDTLMISGGIENSTKIWSRITGEVIHDLPHDYGTPAVDFSPDGLTVCTGSYDGKVRVWNTNTGEIVSVLIGNEDTIWSVNYSPDGKFIAAGGNDDKVFVWNVDTGQLIHELKDAKHNIWEVLYNPMGTLLLSSGSDNTIRIYDVQTGKLIKTLLGHSMVPLSMDFSPNGKLLASGGDDKTIKIWDTNTWTLKHTLKGENEAIHSVVFIDNNKVLAGGTDKKVIGELFEYHFGFTGFTTPINATLWDIENNKILQTISEHTNDIGLGIDVSSDGKLLATPSKDKTVKIWKIIKKNSSDFYQSYSF